MPLQSPTDPNDRAGDPWDPPVWWHDPAKRQNTITLLKRHNERLYADAEDFYLAWRAEIDGDARATEPAA